MLRGNQTDKVRQWGHDALPTFGVGQDHSQGFWQAVFRQMMGHDLMRPDPERHGALRMTQTARPILRGEKSITLRKDAVAEKPVKTRAKALISDDAAPLFAALKAKRRALAEAARVPAYVIFPDRTLIEMAEKRPENLDALAAINGIGAKKLEKYGRTFLAVITGEEPAQDHPARRKLAGTQTAPIYDQLMSAQSSLRTGMNGLEKPMSCSASELARLAKSRPSTLEDIERVLGARRADRFGAAFLEVLAPA